MKHLFKLFVVFLMVLTSCTEDTEELQQVDTLEVITKAELSNATLEQRIAYNRKHSKILASWVAKRYNNILLKTKLNRSNTKGEYFFLVEDLIKADELSKAATNTQLETAYNAFMNVEGENWYPIVRIFDVNTTDVTRNADDDPLIFIEDATVDGEMASIYVLCEDDELEDYNGTLDSAQNSSQPKVVFEYTTQCGRNVLQPPVFVDCSSDADDGGGGGGTTSSPFLKLENATIKDLKEGYPFRSEFGIKAYKITNLAPSTSYECADPVFMSDNCHNYIGKRIATVKRRHRNDARTYNYSIEKKADLSFNDILIYVIFEQDHVAPWKVADNSDNFPQNSIWNIKYRSWQTKYDEQNLSLSPIHNLPSWNYFNNENSDIKYNLK